MELAHFKAENYKLNDDHDMMKLNCAIAGQIKGLLEVLKTIKKNSSTSVTVTAHSFELMFV